MVNRQIGIYTRYLQILICASLSFLVSCSDSKELAPNYLLVLGEFPASLHQKNGANIISPAIFAYCVQDKYILVKRHPDPEAYIRTAPSEQNTVTDYYIIEILPYSETEHHPEKGITGPLDEHTFDSLIKLLDIKNPGFNSVPESN
jgi:hypothetical protein